MPITPSLQTQIDAVRARIAALSPNASAEDLAMLAKAIEAIGGQATVFDVIETGQQQVTVITQAASAQQASALSAIQSAQGAAVQAVDGSRQQALNQIAAAAASAAASLSAGTLLQPLGVDLANANGTALPLTQSRLALQLSGSQSLALLPSEDSVEQPVARLALLRNLTWRALRIKETSADRVFTVAPLSVTLFVAESAGGLALRWRAYSVASLADYQLATSPSALQIGAYVNESRLARLSDEAYLLWALDSNINALRARLLRRIDGSWQVGSEQQLAFASNQALASQLAVDVAAIDSSNLVRVWFETTHKQLRAQRIALSGDVLSLDANALTLDWVNDTSLYDCVLALPLPGGAVGAFWTRMIGTSDFRHRGCRLTLSGGNLSNSGAVDINSASSSTPVTLPCPYAAAVRASDGAIAFVYQYSGSSFAIALRNNNSSFTNITSSSFWTGSKTALGNALAARWIGSSLMIAFVEHDAAATVRWALYGSTLSQIASGTWTLPRQAATMNWRRTLQIVARSASEFALLVGGASSARPLAAIGAINGAEVVLSDFRELALLPAAQSNIHGWQLQELTLALADGYSNPPTLMHFA